VIQADAFVAIDVVERGEQHDQA